MLSLGFSGVEPPRSIKAVLPVFCTLRGQMHNVANYEILGHVICRACECMH